MNPHSLPPLPPIGQAPAPGASHNNPGLIDVSSQCYPAVRSENDQTQHQPTLSSASLVNSNGESQRPAQLDTIGSNGVSVSSSSSSLTNHSGEGGQRLNLKATEIAHSTGSGLAADAHADFVSHAFPILPIIAKTTSPAVTLNANTNRSDGLPSNVNIR